VPSWVVRVWATAALALSSVALRLLAAGLDPIVSAVAYGAAVVAAAFLLAWAAEAAQVDISASLAVAVLALVAVLPEYAVDLYFAFTAGHRPEYAQYAAANMTGSNRLLIGLGWPMVVLVFAWAGRRGRPAPSGVCLEPRQRVELAYLAVAGVYAFVIPLRGRLTLLDAGVLLGIFVAYGLRVAKEERGEPELVGVAASLETLPTGLRRSAVAGLLLAAALSVLAAAKPFAESLVQTGRLLGIDEFILVQWVAPLASEAPEMVVAALFASRGNGSAGIGTLLSSKVNQWTLLVGSLPVAHLLGGGGTHLQLDARQNAEFLLTAAQTVLGIALLIDLRFGRREAVALLLLFALQPAFPQQGVRIGFAAAYLLLAGYILMRRRGLIGPLLRALVKEGAA